MGMKILEWLAGAKRKIDGLDAELIAVRVFAPAGGGSAESLMSEGVDRSWLAAHREDLARADLVALADEMVVRRAVGEPLAYLLGCREFYGRKFWVSPEVLVPRPETEGLVELVRELAEGLSAERGEDLRILEVGTGSGCIAVTLALEMPGLKVTATDVSEGALEVAKANNVTFGAGVEFLRGDLLEDSPEELGRLDILVANLPYVDEEWEWLDKKSLGFEPDLALYAEDGGLGLYKKLILQIKARGEGFAKYVVFEADPCQHEDLRRFAEENGLKCLKTEGFGLVFENSGSV